MPRIYTDLHRFQKTGKHIYRAIKKTYKLLNYCLTSESGFIDITGAEKFSDIIRYPSNKDNSDDR